MTIYLLGSGPITRVIYNDLLSEGQDASIVSKSKTHSNECHNSLNYTDFTLIKLTCEDKVIIAWRSMGAGLVGTERDAVISALGTNLRNVNKIIYLSSGSIYGNSSEVFSEETIANPQTTYAREKLEIESWLHEVQSEETIVCRISNVVGASGLPNLLNTILSDFKNREPITLFEPNRFMRDYISVDMVSRFIRFFLHDYQSQDLVLDTFNISSNDPVSTSTILKCIRDILGYDIPYTTLAIPDGIPSSNRLNNEKVLEISKINFSEPRISLIDYIQTRVNELLLNL